MPKNVDVKIFISYAHRDPPLFRDALESLLRWPGVSTTVWTDENIVPGLSPDKSIRAALEEMHIFLAMITPHFDASCYIHEVEVPAARRRHEQREVLIAPVVVSDPGGTNCEWLLGLERLPHKEKSWVDIRKESYAIVGHDDANKLLRDGVYKLVQQIRAHPRRPGS